MTRVSIVSDDEPLVNKPSHRLGPGEVCGVKWLFGEKGEVRK